MSNINGIHLSSSSMPDNGINDTSKRLSITSSNSITATNNRLKLKNAGATIINETRSMKELNKKPKTIDSKKKRLIHSDSNNNTNSTKKIKQTSSRHLFSHPTNQLEHIPSSSNKKEPYHHHVIDHDYCDSCGERYGEMISCDTCPVTYHLLCANPPLSKEDIPNGSYFCENCRASTTTQEELRNKDKQQKVILPFSFDPKKNLQTNGYKKNQQYQEQIKLPTASNVRSLVQPTGEIKFRAINNKSKLLSSSSSNLKRKRIDSSSLPLSTTNSPILNPVEILNPQIEALHRLFLSCRSEEFHGPSLPSNDVQKNFLTRQKYCFICRKSSIKHGPSIHCDYCSLTYHLDCLNPPMTSLPSSSDKWMCPNHLESILDRYLLKKKTFSTSERVKIYHQYSQTEQNTLVQEFIDRKQRTDYLLSKTVNNHRLERIDISEIPKVIEEFYLKSNLQQKQICEIKINDDKKEEDKCLQTVRSSDESSSAYNPCVWDTLQAILNHIIDGHTYVFSSIDYSSIENDNPARSSLKNECNTIDTIDTLLYALNEPNYTLKQCTIDKTNNLDTLIAAANSCETDERNQIPISLTNSVSLLIDLSQFRLSHAALIHLRSEHVIYIRKHVIWFGSSPLNDICLTNFNHSQTCQYITERHACLYYDRKRNLFELLNYSEYGTIVNDLRYGVGAVSDDDQSDNDNNKQEKIENDNLQKCYCCLTKSSYHSAWDGPAQIEQGTVIKIGCHEFLFYRHIVR